MQARTVNSYRGARAARICAPSARAYHTSAAETSRAPTTTSHGQVGTMPAMASTTPSCSRRIRPTCRERVSWARRVFSSASVKCWPHTMIEVVISPSVTMWTISQRACGMNGWIRTTTIRISIHTETGRAARRCQEPRSLVTGRDGCGMVTSGIRPGGGGSTRPGSELGVLPGYDPGTAHHQRKIRHVRRAGHATGRRRSVRLVLVLLLVCICVCALSVLGPLGGGVHGGAETDHHDHAHGDEDRGQGDLQRSEEHTSELQSRGHLVCRLLLEKKKQIHNLETDNTI